MSRLAAALVLALLVGAPRRARAQEVPGRHPRPTPQLPQLKAQRDKALERHDQAMVQVSVLSEEARALTAQLDQANAKTRRLQAEDAGVLRDRELQAARLAQRRISGELARKQLKLSTAQDTEQIQRTNLIHARWSYIDRLLEVADRLRVIRREQAKAYINEALTEMDLVGELEKMTSPSPLRPKPFPIDPGESPQDLAKDEQFYEALVEEERKDLKVYRPLVRIKQERVRHLAHLVSSGYAVDRLPQQLAQAREALEKEMQLERQTEERIRAYQAQIQRIERLVAEQNLLALPRGKDGQ